MVDDGDTLTQHRVAAVGTRLAADMNRLSPIAGHRPEILARLYAGTTLRTDDNHGRQHDLVVQADELRWSELNQLIRIVQLALDASQHPPHGPCTHDCAYCQAVTTINRLRTRRPSHPRDSTSQAGPRQ